MVRRFMEASLPLCEFSLVENYGATASSTSLDALVDSFLLLRMRIIWWHYSQWHCFFSCFFYALKGDPLEMRLKALLVSRLTAVVVELICL